MTWRTVAVLPEGETLVSMIDFRGVLLVATNRCVYRLKGEEGQEKLCPVEFEAFDPEAPDQVR